MNMNSFLSLFSGALAVSFLLSSAAMADQALKVAPIFGDHMVLQRGIELPVWGIAEPGAVVKVKLGKQSGETNDLAEAHPEVVSELRKAFDHWIAEMADPIKGGPKVWTADGAPATKKMSREEKDAAKEKKRQMNKEANEAERAKARI